MESDKNGKQPHGYLSLKELADGFKVNLKTFKKELEQVKGLELRPYQRNLSPAQQKKVFNHLGNPFE